MIFESILIVALALFLDLVIGDPKNKFHPTVWVGTLIAKLVPFAKNESAKIEKLGGIVLTLTVTTIVATLLIFFIGGINQLNSLNLEFPLDFVIFFLSISTSAVFLKSTIAIRGMEKHAMSVINSLEKHDIKKARTNLSKIVKRNTTNLDEDHILSGVLESVSENTVDGITGPLFYFAIFGLPGAFVYRTINTIDSMIGYKTSIFKNIGWFGANCDNVLNFIPARVTALIMILSAVFLKRDWRKSYELMKRDGRKTDSPNAGYPMATLAGALGTKFEKIDHYCVGEGSLEFTKLHVKSAISLMKLTSVLFCGFFTIPVVILLSYLGWWIHA